MAFAWALLAAAAWGSYGLYSAPALALLCLAAVALAGAIWLRDPLRPGADARIAAPIALGTSTILSLTSADALYGPPAARYLFVAVPLVALGTLVRAKPARVCSLVASGMLAATAGVIQILQVPRSGNDVWWIMQSATGHLFSQNPYAHCLAFDPQPETRCVFPYPPGIAVLEWPFRAAFGDVRYAYLAAAAALALLILKMAGLGAAPWAALAFSFPRFLYELNQAWTEPVLAVLVVAVVVAGRQRRRWLAILLLGLALASKQHLVFLLPLAAAFPVIGISGTVAAVGVAAVVCLPWIVLGPAEFWHDTVTWHYTLPARDDSLSISSWLHAFGAADIPTMLSLVVTLAVLALLVRRGVGNGQGLLLGGAAVLLVFDMTSKVAFFNHYLLVLLLTAAALALWQADSAALPPPRTADASRTWTARAPTAATP